MIVFDLHDHSVLSLIAQQHISLLQGTTEGDDERKFAQQPPVLKLEIGIFLQDTSANHFIVCLKCQQHITAFEASHIVY